MDDLSAAKGVGGCPAVAVSCIWRTLVMLVTGAAGLVVGSSQAHLASPKHDFRLDEVG